MAYNTSEMIDEEIKTLYVGNLPLEASEPLLIDLFQHMGTVLSCKIIRDGISDPYCFIEFADQTSAMTARTAMDGRNLLGKNLKVNWATSSGMITHKADTSKHFHVFVGDLSPEITTQRLKEAFTSFGEISDCRVVKDLQTLKSKGYGFVSYVNKQDAENALSSMNGQWLGNRVIRTNWATRKPMGPGSGALGLANNTTEFGDGDYFPSSYDNSNSESNYNSSAIANAPITYAPGTANKRLSHSEVSSRTTPTNTTVYCGGIMNGLSEQLMRDAFKRFGEIKDVRVFKEKGFAFIKFTKKDNAVNAIATMNNAIVAGNIAKCYWGKEYPDPGGSGGAAAIVSPFIPSAVVGGSGMSPSQQSAIAAALVMNATGNASAAASVAGTGQQQTANPYFYPGAIAYNNTAASYNMNPQGLQNYGYAAPYAAAFQRPQFPAGAYMNGSGGYANQYGYPQYWYNTGAAGAGMAQQPQQYGVQSGGTGTPMQPNMNNPNMGQVRAPLQNQ